MLKYNDIISRLSDEQKVRILTGVGNLSGKDLKILGIPKIKIANIKDYGRELYPHANSLAHSWDDGLWQDVAKEKTAYMLDDGVDFAIVPGAKIKLSPYRREISEDPYLASRMSAAFAKGASLCNMHTAASGYYLTGGDAEWMDVEPNERILQEFVVNPYMRAIRNGGSEAVVTDKRFPNEKYENACAYIQEKAVGNVRFLICDKATEANTVDLISRGIVCLEASANSLESAMTRYKKLIQQIDRNEGASDDQLKDDIDNLVAISNEKVDAALDTALDFVFSCANAEKCGEEFRSKNEDTSFLATLKSSVLIKNEGDTLPLDRGVRYAVVGAAVCGDGSPDSFENRFVSGLSSRGYSISGFARGYDKKDYFNTDLVDEAVALCDKADTVILFLGFGYKEEKQIPKTENLTLPANQLYLADRLLKKNRKIIAVISSGHAPDIEFTRAFDGIILAPLEVKHSADALVRIVVGEYNPSGKLAYTLYAGSEGAFSKRKVYRNHYGMKSGPFVGYRYYDTANMRVGYPFGHGLSYTNFKYSSLSVTDGHVVFTVENMGNVRGIETPQVYVGIKRSSVLRPKKELCGYARVDLMPGEKRTVELEIEIPTVYQSGKELTEGGVYTVSVGASVSDIRLTVDTEVAGVTLEGDRERLCDYLQTVTNVKEDKFTLEAKYGSMKKSIKNILFGIGAIALAVSVAVFNSLSKKPALFLSVISGILAASAVVFFIIEARDRSKAYKAERRAIDEANKEYFDGAEEIPVLSTNQMFVDEFDTSKEEKEIKDTIETETQSDYSEYINSSFMINDAVSEFTIFAAERGFKLSTGFAENLLASIMTTKLIVTNGMSADDFNDFMIILSEYFGTEVFVDEQPDMSENGHSLFFSADSNGDYLKKNVLLALDAAKARPEAVYFAALNNVTAAGFAEYVLPFSKYMQSPKKKNQIDIYNDRGTNIGYNIPANLWLVINLSDTESVENLPLAYMRFASVLAHGYSKCPLAEALTVSHGFSRYQIEYILEKQGSKNEIPEEVYKKIDKLEKYAFELASYSIGNKLWLTVEKYNSLLLSIGAELNEALDFVLAVKILPSMLSALKEKLTDDDKTPAEMIEFIFGEEYLSASKELLDSVTEVNARKAEIERKAAEQAAAEIAKKEAEERAAAELAKKEAEERAAAELAKREAEALAVEESAKNESSDEKSEDNAEIENEIAAESAENTEPATSADEETESPSEENEGEPTVVAESVEDF